MHKGFNIKVQFSNEMANYMSIATIYFFLGIYGGGGRGGGGRRGEPCFL